jgi:hypothetical protein
MYDTKNLLDHSKQFRGSEGQMLLQQYLTRTMPNSNQDQELLKRKEVEYCVDGYKSFKSVEHTELHGLLQTCANFRVEYGKFDVTEALVKRRAVAQETVVMYAKVSYAKILLNFCFVLLL